ncbi:hypothetical protein HN51_060403 [Arachis hypogaea]|uniref:DUF7950 domain-containing protein n=2 Tax=Arachis TaxID=3817 RepID=A0A444X9M6_ARAHY|nr:uncharacterized protein LOC107471585 [Arachis duranensis]XP_016181885.1 uncharacterized protein LOC107623982 [Arachis ipaensis]XP_025625702.1 uncharacterized protein LOC112718003 [Arachis hypogaea]XP_025685690.1 uncharacterized protein LOC112786535 [Arachis hypogaea]QHO05000.1 uncharacterized protein DS421_13g444950 [Arachis hypogaea]QHO17607.1 uncharacterized protein DS421_10g313600 [Arachis hypogaea]RYQ86380.1 hypothetical protein Ahy_B10g106052 [Arachis hypogaea]RYR32674.1 hypothetical
MDGGADAWSVPAWGASSANAAPHDNRILNRIMLRFRPIAPKPVAGGSLPSSGEAQGSNGKAPLTGKRAKRKYVRVRRNSVSERKNNDKSHEKLGETSENVAVVTLQLMPEKEDPKQHSLAGDSWCKNVDLDLTVENIQILDNNLEPPRVAANLDSVKVLDPLPPPSLAAVESWVTVESVTGTCMGEGEGARGIGIGCCTDAEMVKSLEDDTCPAFVSDGYFRVGWVNEAFKKMVASEGNGLPLVWVKVKDNAAWCFCYSYPAFTCGVRLQYTWRNEKCTKMVPCDVWRLESGGFAWRLDVKAALSLGL